MSSPAMTAAERRHGCPVYVVLMWRGGTACSYIPHLEVVAVTVSELVKEQKYAVCQETLDGVVLLLLSKVGGSSRFRGHFEISH